MAPFTIAQQPSILNRQISRGDIGCLLLAEFFIAALPPLEQTSTIGGLLQHIAAQNVFFLFAVFVAAKRILESDRLEVPSRLDIFNAAIGTILFAVSCFFGVEQLAGLGLTVVIILFMVSGTKDLSFRSAMLVCFALALNIFWGPLIFQTFTAQIIAFDSSLLKLAYSFLRPDIKAEGVTFASSNGFGIVIVGVCSVFNSASVAFLASTAIGQYARPGWFARDAVVAAIVLAAMIVINTCRLVLMGWDRDLFAYWHDGGGAPVVAITQTIVIAVIATLGAIWAAREKRF